MGVNFRGKNGKRNPCRLLSAAESGLKHLLSGFCYVSQAFMSRLEAERRGEKSTYTGRLSYENNVSLIRQDGFE
jgi:hypothetical protein